MTDLATRLARATIEEAPRKSKHEARQWIRQWRMNNGY